MDIRREKTHGVICLAKLLATLLIMAACSNVHELVVQH